MTSHTDTHGKIAPGQSYAELGTVTLNGRDYASGGACIDDHRLVAYLGANQTVTTFDGQCIGRYSVVSSWPTPRSFVSSRWYAVRIVLTDGRIYRGRSAGDGMIVFAKRSHK